MDLKLQIFIENSGKLRITELNADLSLDDSYRSGTFMPNTVYCSISPEKNGSGANVIVHLYDMIATRGIRELHPIFHLLGDLKQLIVSTNKGLLPAGSISFSGAKEIMRLTWTKGIPTLYSILVEVEKYYHKKNDDLKPLEPWLSVPKPEYSPKQHAHATKHYLAKVFGYKIASAWHAAHHSKSE